MGKVWTREGWTGGVWMGGVRAWILERGWVVCGRLIRGGVMCRTRLSWYWSAWMQSPG
ncbi:unnamed protein product, partial [Brassica rapa subsp. trilocularis]